MSVRVGRGVRVAEGVTVGRVGLSVGVSDGVQVGGGVRVAEGVNVGRGVRGVRVGEAV